MLKMHDLSGNQNIAAFNAAHAKLHEFIESPELQESWAPISESADEPAGSPRFWRFFGRLVRRMDDPVSSDSNSAYARQVNDTFRLMGSVPAVLCADQTLSEIRRYQAMADLAELGGDDVPLSIEAVPEPPVFDIADIHRTTAFNALLKSYARDHRSQDTSAHYMQSKLADFAHSVKLDTRIRHAASGAIHRIMRGARHELGFEQQLPYTGRDFREATVYEDARGFDYLVAGSYDPLFLDVKADLHGIQRLGESERSYVVKDNGVLAVTSGLTDNDFEDRLYVPPAIAAEKAEALEAILRQEETRQLDAA
jgi:hypothetical protein